MADNPSKKLNRLLAAEEKAKEKIQNTEAAVELKRIQTNLLEHIREVGRGGDLGRIIATERAIVEGDLARYANSQPMVSSLKAAIEGIDAIESHIGIVDDKTRYLAVDRAHRLAKNRKQGLPFESACQPLHTPCQHG